MDAQPLRLCETPPGLAASESVGASKRHIELLRRGSMQCR